LRRKNKKKIKRGCAANAGCDVALDLGGDGIEELAPAQMLTRYYLASNTVTRGDTES